MSAHSIPPPVKVLLVDDNAENLLALEAILAPLGHDLVRARSGAEALRHLLLADFALILLDVTMPVLDGFQTADLIKQRERTRHVPIIFLTAHAHDLGQLRGYEVGGVDYLSKPFDPAVLRSKVSVFADLHRLTRQAELLAHRALHDPLTGLPNRTLFADRLELALARLPRSGAPLSVLFLDLDRFKEVNDRLGHDAGDALLIEVTARIREVLRPADTVARLGGDEFTILLEGADDEAAAEVADRVLRVVSTPVVLGVDTVFVSTSTGIAVTDGPVDPAELMRRADTAMYRAKEAGGGRHEFFNVPPTRVAEARAQEKTLLAAYDAGQLALHVRPVRSLLVDRIVGMDARLVWQHPLRGPLDPVEAVPRIDQAVLFSLTLTLACREAARWSLELPLAADLAVTVPMPASALTDVQLAATIGSALGETGLEPERLCLEVSSDADLLSAEVLVALGRLRGSRATVSVTPFAEGVPLQHDLSHLPADVVRLPPRLLLGLGGSRGGDALVAAALCLAHMSGLVALADCDDPSQLAALAALGCDLVRGAVVGDHGPASELGDVLAGAAQPV